MTKVFVTIATVFVLAFLIGCGAKLSTNNVSAETPQKVKTESSLVADNPDASLEFKSQVNASAIHSFDDYDKAKSAAWKRYDDRKMKAWKEYDEAKNKALRELAEFDTAELLKVRDSNRQAYYEYIDAEKLNDFERSRLLEKSVPELAEYKRLTSEKYQAYAKVDEDAYKRFKTIDKNAYKVYGVEESTAYKAFTANANK
jgi:hypothetical protein